MEKITQTLCTAMNSDSFVRVIFADRRKKSTEYRKVTLRPVSIKGEYMYQAEYHYDKKVTHRNISYFEGISFAEKLIEEDFKQINILTEDEDIQILASKPDKPRITRSRASHKKQSLDHDRKKQHLLQEGQPADFLVELGVMSEDGHVRKQHYGKFRQINRFLEIADNCFSDLPSRGTLRVIYFGCGKSYLTFALYYYLKKIQNRDVEIIGLDLKEDVIEFCSGVAEKLNYSGLKFLTGDIADYKAADRSDNRPAADMVVTLHACDTATDYALINAVSWGSSVILSVPCCQHELFRQINEPVNAPMLKHGIIRDKFTELLTDALRGLKLEAAGYDVNMIEFTSMEHTSKNIMIKALYNPKPEAMKKASLEYEALKSFYNVNPTIDRL